MEKLKFWTLCALCALLLGSCRGQSDDGEVEVQLVPSVTTIVADGVQEVTFEVYYGIDRVTMQAEIYSVSHPDVTVSGAKFSTTEAGEYTFHAKYGNTLSKVVKIVAEEAMVNASRFVRHICVMDITGTWCTFCPEGYRKLVFYTDKKEWKDIVHILALHDGASGKDPMALDVTTTIATTYSLEFPSFITDLRDTGSLVNNVSDIQPSFNRSIDDYPAHCDVKLATTLSEGEVSISATLFSEKTENYALAVWLYENGVVAEQKDGSFIHKDYEHKHVARALLSRSWRGDSLGMVTAEEEVAKEYTATLSEEWNDENMFVMALAIDEDGYVNNVAVCPLGESVDYKYLAE